MDWGEAIPELGLLSVAASFEDVTDRALRRGQIGTVVEQLALGVCEFEFNNDEGRTYVTLPLRASQLLQLYHAPSHQAT